MASWKDLRKFLENNGYVLKRHGSRDDWYEKTDANGNVKRVSVSRGSGEIKQGTFKRILKQQLEVDKEQFNEGLRKKSK